MNGPAGTMPYPQNKAARAWSRLAMIWGGYYLVSFTLGQNPAYMQLTIWVGTALVGLFTLPVFLRRVRFRHLPREGILLLLFLLWTLPGGLAAANSALFARHFQMVFEFALIVLFVSVILKYSGASKWFFMAYFGVAVLRVFYGEEPISLEHIASTKAVARIDAANAVGYYCAMGIVGILALMQELKSLWLRGLLIAGGGVALYGVVLSASRGAMVALMATAVLWPTLCLVGGSRFKLKGVLGAVLVLILSYWFFQLIVQDTYMGVRFTRATQLEDGSSQKRLEFFFIGMRIFASNPVFGCGLGQFGDVSGTGFYAHNEFTEIASSTGLPGLVLYYSVYFLAWRRLSWSLRWLGDPLLRYRINIVRMILLILLISGLLSRPIFLTQDAMFLVGIVVGMAHWAERTARQARGAASAVLTPDRPSMGFPPPVPRAASPFFVPAPPG